MKLVWVLLAMTAVARADQPAPAKAACAPASTKGGAERLVITKAGPVGCWKKMRAAEQCAVLSPTAPPRSTTPPPQDTPPPAAAQIRDDGGKPSACAGSKCRPLGKRLAKAISDKETTDDIAVTGDLAVVAIGTTAYAVARDKVLDLKPPREFKRGEDKPAISQLTIVGNLVIADWSNCDGLGKLSTPCAQAVVVDANGANKGASFRAGDAHAMFTAVAVVPRDPEGAIVALEPATGKRLGNTLALAGKTEQSVTSARIDDQKLVAMWPEADGWKVAWIVVPADVTMRLTTTKLPLCP